MNKSLLLGLWKHLIRVPRPIWQKVVARSARGSRSKLDFMSADHHKVRDFVVMEIPRCGAPLTPEFIADGTGLPLQRTQEILVELEKGLTFLFRNEQGEVAWAYPVTAEPTPHRVTFSTGEQIYAA